VRIDLQISEADAEIDDRSRSDVAARHAAAGAAGMRAVRELAA